MKKLKFLLLVSILAPLTLANANPECNGNLELDTKQLWQQPIIEQYTAKGYYFIGIHGIELTTKNGNPETVEYDFCVDESKSAEFTVYSCEQLEKTPSTRFPAKIKIVENKMVSTPGTFTFFAQLQDTEQNQVQFVGRVTCHE